MLRVVFTLKIIPLYLVASGDKFCLENLLSKCLCNGEHIYSVHSALEPNHSLGLR